jgi:hypothetical protein
MSGLVAPAAHDIAHRKNPYYLSVLTDDEMAEATTQHGSCRRVERPLRISDDSTLRQMISSQFGVEIVARGDALQDVALCQNARALAILVVDNSGADPLLGHPFGDMSKTVARPDRENDSGHRIADSHDGKVKPACAFVKRQLRSGVR